MNQARFHMNNLLSKLLLLIKLLSSWWMSTHLNAEEREKPELLAESPERRRRIAQESGKTEQQVYM